MPNSADYNPFPPAAMPGYQQPPAGYGCRWVWHPQPRPGEPAVVLFRLTLDVPCEATVPVRVSADQRYTLYLDGQRLGRGPMRGDLGHWNYESYQLHLSQGKHLLAASVTWFPQDGAPMAQMYGEPGFLLLAEGPWTNLLSTGSAPWEVTEIHAFTGRADTVSWYYVTGWCFTMDGALYPWGWETDPATVADWKPAQAVAIPVGDGFHWTADYETRERYPQHHLQPAPIPPMLEEPRHVGTVRHAQSAAPDATPQTLRRQPVSLACNDATLSLRWQQLLDNGAPVLVGPHSCLRILIDLDNYYCAYPMLVTEGGAGAVVTMGWSESLYESADARSDAKGNRGEIEGKYVRCVYDDFILEGGQGRRYSTLWWRAGRYVDLYVQTQDEPLTIQDLYWHETRYPLEMEAALDTGDAAFDAVRPLMFRTLQMCSHETYMDCPYYEQLQYVGDTRLEILATYVSTHDDRLPLRAATLFDQSRGYDGLTRSRYPSRVPQVIPPFSLWWVCMVYDLYLWRGREAQVRQMLPGIHAVLSAFGAGIGADDLAVAPNGWNFCDWVPEWNAGWPPDARFGASAVLNLQYLYALDRAIYLLRQFGQLELAGHWSGVRRRLAAAIVRGFWVPSLGLIADDLGHRFFSEHAQCLALLTNLFQGSEQQRLLAGLLNAPHLARTTVYYSHYLFEALYHVGALDKADKRLSFWRDLPAMGLKTVLEQPEPSRSDCHAWGAHPLYHAVASYLGARPTAPGLSRIRIAPQPATFAQLRGRFPDGRQGFVSFDLDFSEGVHGVIELPEDLAGEFVWRGRRSELKPGSNAIARD